MKKIAFLFVLITTTLLQSGFAQIDLEFPHAGVVLGDKVRLRQEPSTKGTLVSELAFGTTLEVLKISSNSEKIGETPFYHYWVQVQTTDGKKGWIFGKFVSPVSLENPKSSPFFKPNAPKAAFQWAKAEATYSPYYDLEKHSEDMMIGSDIYFLVDVANPKVLYPIRNPEKNSSASIENYFTAEKCCCGTECDVVEEKQKDNSLQFVFEEISEGNEEETEERTTTLYTVQWKDTEFVITKIQK